MAESSKPSTFEAWREELLLREFELVSQARKVREKVPRIPSHSRQILADVFDLSLEGFGCLERANLGTCKGRCLCGPSKDLLKRCILERLGVNRCTPTIAGKSVYLAAREAMKSL